MKAVNVGAFAAFFIIFTLRFSAGVAARTKAKRGF